MVKRILVLLTVFVSLLYASYAIAETNMEEGLWEITTKVEMPGMPMQMPARTHTRCIKKDNMVPQQPEKDQKCEITNRKIIGDTVSWTMKCQTPEGTAVMDGKVTYKGDTFDGEIKMKSPDGMEMTQHISGRWIGKCEK